jgi:hypothetical protein
MTKRQYHDYIQSLSIEKLEVHTSNWKRVSYSQTKEEAVENYDEDEKYLDEEMDLRIQDLQNYAVAEPQSLYGIELKMQQTGLYKAQIQLIETDKTKATLAELILYCEGLNIDLQDFVTNL